MGGQKKRVLVVSQHYWPENFRITDICKGFGEDGIACDVLCGCRITRRASGSTGTGYRGPRRETHEGVEIFRSGEVRRKGNTSLRIFLNYVSFPAAGAVSTAPPATGESMTPYCATTQAPC